MVWFGNVFGLFGFVVLLFEWQIVVGGLVMLIDDQVLCYFMIVEEVFLLVLQGIVYNGYFGELLLYVLDMGDLICICILVEVMICMKGMVLDQDIKIKIMGL